VSRRMLQQRFPKAHLVPSVYVGYDTKEDFEAVHGPLWKQVVLMLTGISSTQLNQAGYEVYDPMNEKVLFRSKSA